MLVLLALPALAGSWTTGEVQDHLITGQSAFYSTSSLPGGTLTTVELKYGLWNSPDVELELYWEGTFVGSALCDAGYSSPGPEFVQWDVTGLTVGGVNDIEIRAVTPPGGSPGGEGVMGALTVDFEDGVFDNDLDGFTGIDGDCDDSDPFVFPGADETCNGVDDDCDGTVDNDALDAVEWFRDVDRDGFGGDESVIGCDQPAYSTDVGGDCDDDEPLIFPGADEHCDAVDEDCDGVIDNEPLDANVYYADADADGAGDPETEVHACDLPVDAALEGDDCDDGDDGVHPGATELCDGVDQDCDGSIDEGLTCDEGDPASGGGDGGKAAITTCGCSSTGGAGLWTLLPLLLLRRR